MKQLHIMLNLKDMTNYARVHSLEMSAWIDKSLIDIADKINKDDPRPRRHIKYYIGSNLYHWGVSSRRTADFCVQVGHLLRKCRTEADDLAEQTMMKFQETSSEAELMHGLVTMIILGAYSSCYIRDSIFYMVQWESEIASGYLSLGAMRAHSACK